ncbi:MAG: PsiF family protein [Rhodoferax sp.]
MNKLLALLVLGLTLSFGTAHAADAEADCAAKAAEKKLAGAAKNSFMKKCVADAGGAAPASSPGCEKAAVDKKLAGAAKSSFMKKCVADEKAGTKPEAAAKPEAAKPVASAAATASKPASAAAPAASAEKKASQQDKMKLCNAEAKGLKGDEFKKKRDECLKK